MFAKVSVATILGFALMANAAPAAAQPAAGISHEQARQHLEGREMVWMNVKDADGSTYEIDAPFLQIELEHDMFYDNKPKTAVSAQITRSNVTEIALENIVCMVWGTDMTPVKVPITSSGFADLKVDGKAVPVTAVGCGTIVGPDGKISGRDTEHLTDLEKRKCTKNYFAKTWACLFTLGIYCAACPT